MKNHAPAKKPSAGRRPWAPVIAITGGPACGKSTVGGLLAAQGVDILDTDAVVAELLEQSPTVRAALRRHFGPGIFDRAGRIKKSVLAKIVFADPARLRVLEDLLHPLVKKRVGVWRGALRRRARPGAVLIPLLFEAGITHGWSAIVCVATTPELMAARCRARGWSPQETRRRLAAQWPLARKMEQADYVIRNDGSLDNLARAVRRTWRRIEQRERTNT
ncbi:MAG: dephospho-CoA kinase [Candidatus Marinimicrobia bacterium]|nr:dephospho-CoA kinase [Candidatus Neomarinimicrobiota bacterium]